MKTQLKPGQNTSMDITRANGNILLTVLISLFTDGVSMTFTNHPTLDRTFGNLAEGRAYLRYLKGEAAASTELWLIEDRAGDWTSGAAVADQAERALIDSVNATLNAAQADLNRETAVQQAAVADIMAGTGQTGGWYGARKAAQQAVTPISRAIHPTRTRVHCKPATAAELDLIRSHRNGVVTTRPGQSWTILRAIERRGYGQPTYRPGTRIITSITLNARGHALAGQQEMAA